MKLQLNLLLIIISVGFLYGCQTQAMPDGDASFDISTPTSYSDQFADYWYQGKAELSSYYLEQARYGEIHEGHAVLVFVTEDFSKSKQVKLDNSGSAGNDKVPIMKLNFTKKFLTGLYPYSMMQSVFTPVDVKKYPHSLKTSMSSQEWCGHTFTQFNLEKKSYAVKGFSYFESEGDIETDLSLTLLEDEIWNKIRLAPEQLPTGELSVIPGSFYLRLKHRPIRAEKAILSLEREGNINTYTIDYPNNQRKLSISFEAEFPHKILRWKETLISGWGAGAQKLTTKAKLKETLVTDYWTRHRNDDRELRARLGL